MRVLLQPATFLIQNPGQPARVVPGIVASVQPDGAAIVRDRRSYRIRIVPGLWLLKHRTTSRIFQDMSVPDIVSAVLDGASVPRTWKLGQSYPSREYCVQYQESDYAFLRRLLAEDGILFWFELPTSAGDGETMVLADNAQAYPLIAGSAFPNGGPRLLLRSVGGMIQSDDNVHQFALRQRVRPTHVLLRDFDFRRPLLDLRSEAESGPTGISGTASAAILAATAQSGSDGTSQKLRVYGHRGEYGEPEVNPARARVELEQRRRRSQVGEGASPCRRLLPGHRFHLDAAMTDLAGEYVVPRVDHEGRGRQHTGSVTTADGHPSAYTNRFECVPADVVFRPKRPKPVLRQVLESATVVGPANEEIYTDAYGRIKVQFHWDLEGTRDERSSCWMRVVQAWSGAGWGFQLIPRAGKWALTVRAG